MKTQLDQTKEKLMWKVEEILDANRIKVASNWKWDGAQGYIVSINGYTPAIENMPDAFAKEMAKSRLRQTLLGKDVALRNPTHQENGTIYCEVFLNDVNVANYFFDFKKRT